uniref:TRIO salivary gland protein n=1 Tax=Anopheles christyi TaxID=43041 RepID=A0A182JW69_9DIPT
MCRPLSAVLILLTSLYLQLDIAVGAEDPQPEKEICGVKLGRVQDSVKSWLAAAKICPLNKFCDNEVHSTQFNLIPLTCIRWRGLNPASTWGPPPGRNEVLPVIESTMSTLKAMFEPTKADLVKLDEEVGRQLRDAWKELEALQTEVFLSTLASGRTERAVFYSFMEASDNPKLNHYFHPDNVEELLRYNWALPWHTRQRDMYNLIGQLARSSNDPMLETLHAVDMANVVNPGMENREHLLNGQVEKLRDNLSKNSFDTLVSIARRFPQHFTFLSQRLFKSPDADTLPNIVGFIGQLPTDEQRLITTDALLQSLMAENGTLLPQPEYAYPLALLAHDLPSLVNVKAHPDLQQGVDDVRAKFITPISGKSLQYYQNLGARPSSSPAV